MAKSNCMNQYDDVDNRFGNVQCCIRELEAKQARLTEALLEKEELQRQVTNATMYIEETIQKHKKLTCQLTNNYDELWAKYQNKCVELNECKNRNECLNAKVEELIKRVDELGCQVNDLTNRNECLEDENCRLEKNAHEDKQSIMCLRSQIENQKKSLEKSVEELNRALHELDETRDQLCHEKQENCNLKSRVECLRGELTRTIEKCKLEAFQLNRTIDCLRTEIEVQKRNNAELERALCEERNRRQEACEALDKSERKNELLRQTLEKERAQCNEHICRLRQEKADVERERDELEKCAEKRKEDLIKMARRNEQLQMQLDELQCNLDTVIRNNDEKFKTWTDKTEMMRCENRQLKNELSCKSRKITELEDQLTVTRKARAAEVESIHCLKIQLENLKCKLNVSVPLADNCRPCPPSLCTTSPCAPSLCMPSICPPSLCTTSPCAPSLCTPSICPPSLCTTSPCAPSLCTPSPCAPSLCLPSPCYTVDSNCQLTKRDDCKLDCDILTPTCVKYDECCDNLNEKARIYEMLISKCNSIVNNCCN